MESSEGTFTESQQALIIRFLDSRGYDVNTPDLRPKVLAASGIIGAELGYLSPSEIPKIAPGVVVSDSEVDSIITELKSLASSFKPKSDDKPEDVIAADEDLTEAGERVKSAREKINHIDDILARLRG
jgi:predicted type IV restriction endonuclease